LPTSGAIRDDGRKSRVSAFDVDSDVAIWELAALNRLGHRLRRLRRGLGLSVPEVAAILGVSRTEILHRETPGSRGTTLFDMQLLAMVYGYRIELQITPLDPSVQEAPLASGRSTSRVEPIPRATLIKKLLALSTVDALMDEYELSEDEVMAAFETYGLRPPKRRLRAGQSGRGW
jgi:transcriptional regulator with XRE-family HTH domain